MTTEDTSPSSPCADFTKLWDFDHPAATEARFAAEAASAASGDWDRELQALTQVARAQGLQGQFAKAHATLDAVDARLSRTPASRAMLRSLLERGRLFSSASDRTRALPRFVEAWQLASDAGEDDLAVDAAHMAALAKQDEPDEALAWDLKALHLAQTSEAPEARRWLASLHNNLGWTHFDRGAHERALHFFKEAVALRREASNAEALLRAQWCVARTLRAMGQNETALSAQQGLLKEYEARGMPAGFVYEELAETHLALGRPGHGPLFARAFELLETDPHLVNNESERLARLRRLATE